MAEIYKKLESEASTVRYIVLVLLGAGINFTVGFGFMLSSLTALVQSPSQALTSTGLPTSVVILVVFYFIIGVVYSTSISLAFQPKRIISPLYIQITTSAFVPILILSIELMSPVPDWVSFSAIALFSFLISFILFFVAGLGQTPIVRYLVGLNGTKENTNSFGLVIDGTLENVLKIMRNDSFQEALSIGEEHKNGEHSFVFRTLSARKQQLFIAVMTDQDNEKKTHLATVSYVQTYYGISKTGDLIEEGRKYTVRRALRKAKLTYDDETDSQAQFVPYNYALSITESKLLTLRSLPPHSKAILIGLGLMFLIMTVLWKFNFISPEMAETFWIFAGFAALFDLLPLLKTKPEKQN